MLKHLLSDRLCERKHGQMATNAKSCFMGFACLLPHFVLDTVVCRDPEQKKIKTFTLVKSKYYSQL